MTVARPLAVAELGPSDVDAVVVWMNQPYIAAPMDLRPPIEAEQVTSRRVPIFDELGAPIMTRVGLLSVRDASARLLGFAITYGWDNPYDSMREIDVALPASDSGDIMAYVEAQTRLSDFLFKHGGVIEVLVRLRPGRGTRALVKSGMRVVGATDYVSPVDGTPAKRTVLAIRPEEFYASFWARRFECRP